MLGGGFSGSAPDAAGCGQVLGETEYEQVRISAPELQYRHGGDGELSDPVVRAGPVQRARLGGLIHEYERATA